MNKPAQVVSPFYPLGNETMKQTTIMRHMPCNNAETTSLKSLALLALERNKPRNTSETEDYRPVSVSLMDETDFTEFYEERAAIAEYDGGLSRDGAEVQAEQELQAWRNKRTLH